MEYNMRKDSSSIMGSHKYFYKVHVEKEIDNKTWSFRQELIVWIQPV